MGREAVKTIVDKIQGRTPPKRIDLAAIVVARPDLEKPEVRSVLFPDMKKYIR
jgi:hypothetical protein